MLALNLAIRFLRAGRGQTILIISGISIAIAAQIFIGLLITSLQQTLIDRTVGNQPQITIQPANEALTIQGWEQLKTEIEQTDLVGAVSVSASGNAFLYKGNRNAPVLVRGFDSEADSIYGLQDSIYEGRWEHSQNAIIVGKNLKDDFGLVLGEEVLLRTAEGKTGSFAVSGFFDLGISQLNQSWIITDVQSSQSLFGYTDGITDIEITVQDLFAADEIAAELESHLNDPRLRVENWKEQNEQLLSGLQGQSISSIMIQVFIILSVVIAISAILAITVFQKSRQLGILKAMGITDRSASLIFIFQGLIIGLIGSVAGILLGLGLLFGFSAGTSQQGAQPLIDIDIEYGFIALSWVIAITASVLATLVPARRSLRLNPIDVIREG